MVGEGKTVDASVEVEVIPVSVSVGADDKGSAVGEAFELDGMTGEIVEGEGSIVGAFEFDGMTGGVADDKGNAVGIFELDCMTGGSVEGEGSAVGTLF